VEPDAYRWKQAVAALVALYRDVDRRSLSLPVVTAMPWARFALSLLRIPVCVLIDLACVPVNAVVLTRNLLPGRWSLQRSRSWPCLQGVALWIWRGEGTAVALVVIRPLVCTLLASHFRRRLHLVRRRLYLDEGLPTDVQAPLLDQLDQALRHWKAPSVGHIIVTYGLPAAGLLIAVFPSIAGGHFVRSERAIGSVRFAVSGSLTFGSLLYIIMFTMSAFVAKRGVMLGGAGRGSSYPTSIKGAGAYGEERRILALVGIASRELPLALLLGGLWCVLRAAHAAAAPDAPGDPPLVAYALYGAVGSVALWRRARLGRA